MLDPEQYIDDVLVLWNGDNVSLNKFIAELGKNDFNLKFTYEASPEQIGFLDLLISKDMEGKITTSLYRKDTAGNMILRADSSHPRHIVKNIPYGQYIRLRRNCTTLASFKKADLLKDRLRERLQHEEP